MLISEIVGAKDARVYLPKLSSRGISNELSSYHGFETIGRGVFGDVMTHPKLPYVVKVFEEMDAGYRTFLSVALNNQSNPHFPKFRGRPVKIGPFAMGIRMEKLEPMPFGPYQEIEYLLHDLVSEREVDRPPGSVADEFLSRWPRFQEAVKLLKQARLAGLAFDWHQGNIMQRSDGTPVIIDPFA